ncbi:MAG: site-2 protease family protein [Candidatus Nanopelagicales bacterium]
MTTARELASATSGWQFRLWGFDVSVPWNALLGIGVIAVLWYPEFAARTTGPASIALAALFAGLLMVSILFHELAHAFAARMFSYPVSGITLWAMGGYTTYRPAARHGPLREAAIAVAGPAATLSIAAVAYAGEQVAPPGLLRVMLAALASANLLVGLFNLLPGAPLDGGSVVKAVVWGITGRAETGQVVAAWVGRVLAVLIVVSPFWLAWRTGYPPSLSLILVAVVLAAVLWTGAGHSLRAARATTALSAIGADDLAFRAVPVRVTASVAEVLPLFTDDTMVVVVTDDGRPVGVVSEAAARAVPAAEVTRVPVTAVAATVSPDAPSVPETATALDVVEACQDSGSRFVFVIGEQGTGIIDTDTAFVTEGP